MKLIERLSPLLFSILIHGLAIMAIALINFEFFPSDKTETVNFEVYVDPVSTGPAVQKDLAVTRKAHPAASENSFATLNNDPEHTQDDPEPLPTPVVDHLITDEPRVIFEPKNKQRTDEARRNGYTGIARLKILIDTKGRVRDVKLLNSLKYGLNERAIELARQVKLSPARVNRVPVSVLRDFTITFKATD